MKKEADSLDPEEVLKSLLGSMPPKPKKSLRALFELRIHELNISTNVALDILGMQIRTLNGILSGTQKTVDFTNLIKLASFLQLPKERVMVMYLEELEKNFPDSTYATPEKIDFIKKNFDVPALKKAGLVDSITDFEGIETKIVEYLGLSSIFDYVRPAGQVAFSAGVIEPANNLTRSFWITSANKIFTELNNPYKYDRQALIEYFPEIRWHSTNVKTGLINIIRNLFKIGITVIYLPSLPSIHLRGATFSVNNKPCIVITNYKGFYPTLWFALIHELFHVIFDWEEIRTNKYHLSDEEPDQLSVKAKEQDANNFAREYLFSKEKTDEARSFIYIPQLVNEFARENHVHPSFVYTFNAFDVGKTNKVAWAKAVKENPSITELVAPFENPWSNPAPISDFVKSLKTNIFN